MNSVKAVMTLMSRESSLKVNIDHIAITSSALHVMCVLRLLCSTLVYSTIAQRPVTTDCLGEQVSWHEYRIHRTNCAHTPELFLPVINRLIISCFHVKSLIQYICPISAVLKPIFSLMRIKISLMRMKDSIHFRLSSVAMTTIYTLLIG